MKGQGPFTPDETFGHLNATVKLDLLDDMIAERTSLNRVKEHREGWKRHNAATIIKVL